MKGTSLLQGSATGHSQRSSSLGLFRKLSEPELFCLGPYLNNRALGAPSLKDSLIGGEQPLTRKTPAEAHLPVTQLALASSPSAEWQSTGAFGDIVLGSGLALSFRAM